MHVDVALVDIRMPRMDGIYRHYPSVCAPHPPKLITLTTFDIDEYVYNAAAAHDKRYERERQPAEPGQHALMLHTARSQ